MRFYKTIDAHEHPLLTSDFCGAMHIYSVFLTLGRKMIQNRPPIAIQLDQSEKRTLLRIARQAIERKLSRNNEEFVRDEFALTANLEIAANCFVTLHCLDNLRGCIGSVDSSAPLYLDVHRNAIKAATRDHRFAPLSFAEFTQISIEISCLSEFEPVYNLDCIKIGVHGVYIEYKQRRGLFLPHVAVEQNWDHEKLLSFLCKKAGLANNDWKKFEGLQRFTAIVLSEGAPI